MVKISIGQHDSFNFDNNNIIPTTNKIFQFIF